LRVEIPILGEGIQIQRETGLIKIHFGLETTTEDAVERKKILSLMNPQSPRTRTAELDS
jgi:hypothetical protein